MSETGTLIHAKELYQLTPDIYFPTQRLLCCMEICSPEKLTNVSHFISRGIFRNYKKDAAARLAAASIFGSKKIKVP